VIHEEVARADLSISYLNLLASLNGQILSHHGAPDVVKPWLRRLTAGEALFAIALTEPRGGSDAANLRLRIDRDGALLVLSFGFEGECGLGLTSNRAGLMALRTGARSLYIGDQRHRGKELECPARSICLINSPKEVPHGFRR
jgi:hypothetical protein